MSRDRLERCFDRCAEPAWRVAVSLIGDPHEAFDVVQQSFVAAARKPGRIPKDDPWPWFRQVVIHEARNARRKRKPLPAPVEESGMIDKAPDPAAKLAREDSAAQVRRVLDELPEHEREALVLTHLNGMTHAQAAEALGIPVKTLSSHVSRGMERLKNKLGSKGETLLAGLAAAPIAPPPGGWEGALASWKASAIAALGTTSAAGATAAAGVIVMKKTMIAAGMIVALGIGLGGGVLISNNTGDPPPQPDTARVQPLGEDDAGGPGEASVAGNDSVAENPGELREQLKSARKSEKEAKDEAGELRDELNKVRGERDEFEDKVAALESELEPIRREQAERGPTFTFGKHGKIEAVTGSNWKNLAAASRKVTDALKVIRRHQMEGKQPPREAMLTLQENTEKMRTYEYDTIDVLPTWAKHNGELTHPISHTNLIASELKLAEMPLTESQVAEIERLGLEWEQDYEAKQNSYNDATPRVQKMLDEYVLKGEFVDAVWNVLTVDQRDLFIDEKWHHVAFVDLYCPTLMIIHTSPILTGATIEEVRGKLESMLVEQYSIEEEQLPALKPLLDTWQSDVGGILTPVPKSEFRFYTYDQGVVAANATTKLVKSIRDYVLISEEARAKLLDAYDIYVPRVIAQE